MRVPGFLAAAALAAVLALGVLSGCSETEPAGRVGGAGTTGDPGAFTDELAASALLTVEDLSSQFEVEEGDEDEDDDAPDWGCLDFDDLADDSDEGSAEEGPEAEVQFGARPDPGLPGVFQFVSGSPTVARAGTAMDRLAAFVADCTHVDTTEADGTRWRFTVTSDEQRWAPGADQQVNLAAVGSTTVDGLEVPVSIHLSVLRLGAVTTMVGFFDLTDDAGTAPRELVRHAAARVYAVVRGERPPASEPVLEGYPIGEALEELVETATAEPDVPA